MKRTLACLMGFLFILTALAHGETIILVSDPWCPYSCDPETGEPGYMVEIADTVFKKHGHTVDYRLMGWDLAVKETRAGKYHAVVGASMTDNPDFIFTDNDLGRARNHFFVVKENSWRWNGPASLEGKRIGIIKGYSYGDELDRLFTGNPLVHIASGDNPLAANMELLLGGKIDIIVEDRNVFTLTAMSLYITESVIDAGGYDMGSLYIAFSPAKKESKTYAAMLSNGIAELRKSGELSRILGRYGMSDWQ